MAIEDAPPELQAELEQNVGDPPVINDPAVDMAAALRFHNLNNPGWMKTMQEWWDPNISPGPN